MTEDLLSPDDSVSILGDFDFTVHKSFWSSPMLESSTSDSDKVQLYWHVRVDHIFQDFDGAVPETKIMTFSIGEKWWPMPGSPHLVRHEDDPGLDQNGEQIGKAVLFKGPGPNTTSGSLYGRVLALIVGKVDCYETDQGVAEVFDGGGKVEYGMRAASQYLRSNGFTDPRDARIWEGTRWRARGFTLDYGLINGTKVAPQRPLPTAFLGATDGAGAGVAGKSEDELAEEISGMFPSDTDPDVVQNLAKLVQSSSSHTVFMKNALRVVGDDEEMKNKVMDETSGPWSLK